MRRRAIVGGIVAVALAAGTANAAPRPITDQQAIGFLKGTVSLPAISGGKTEPLPKAQRPYAIRAYSSGPYKLPALNLFYAVGATGGHFMSKKDRDKTAAALLLIGRDAFTDQLAQSVKHPETVTRFGVTVRQYAIATTRGFWAALIG